MVRILNEKDLQEIEVVISDNLDEAKEYADSVKNDLLNGAGAAYDTLKELGELIDENVDAIEALETVATGKAEKEHQHKITDIKNIQVTVDELNRLKGLTATNVQSTLTEFQEQFNSHQMFLNYILLKMNENQSISSDQVGNLELIYQESVALDENFQAYLTNPCDISLENKYQIVCKIPFTDYTIFKHDISFTPYKDDDLEIGFISNDTYLTILIFKPEYTAYLGGKYGMFVFPEISPFISLLGSEPFDLNIYKITKQESSNINDNTELISVDDIDDICGATFYTSETGVF